MKVSIAPPPPKGRYFKCHDCDGEIRKTHVLTETERKTRHFCDASCYGHWKRKTKEAA